jgi:PAS domain S-box-containing protein
MSGLVDQLQARIEELELRLRESEERHRQVTDTIDEVFWMTDPHKNSMLFISSAYERIWGRSCQSVLDDPGRSCQSVLDDPMSFIESIHPLDRDAVIAAFPRQVEGTYDLEYRIARQDGGIRWIHDRAFPLKDLNGVVYRVVGVAQDITTRKESDERFQQVTDTIDEVFWMTDPHKNSMLFISSAYERIWGRSCQSVLDDPSSIGSCTRMGACAGSTTRPSRSVTSPARFIVLSAWPRTSPRTRT